MLADAKRDGRKVAMRAAYDAGFARAMDVAGIDLVLVGDSLGMVMQGRDSTLPVTLDDIVYHTTCVARGLSTASLVSDLPFQADASPMRALDAATRCLARQSVLSGRGGAVPLTHGWRRLHQNKTHPYEKPRITSHRTN